jgi:YHS domain-containing protein
MVRLLIYVFNIVFVVIVGWIASRILQAVMGGASKATPAGPRPIRHSPQPMIHGQTARDPVCGMFVSTEVSHRLEHEGKLLHFCSPECLNKFQSEARHS